MSLLTLVDIAADLEGPFCSCDAVGEVHEDACDLWNNWSWAEGELIWNGTELEPWDPGIWADLDALDEAELVFECTCDPPKLYWCDHCGVKRESMTDLWSEIGHTTVLDKWDDDWATLPKMPACDHRGDAVCFVDNTVVFARSRMGSWKNEPKDQPDLSLYLDMSWEPRGLALMLPWKDYGLPYVPFETAVATIRYVFNVARAGSYVEVGCIGAHGRTGTVLACMAILAGTPGADAVAWVKANYCQRAVEDIDQRWFVDCFAAELVGDELPPRPIRPKPKYEPKTKKHTTVSSEPVRYEAGDPCPKDPSHKLVMLGPSKLVCAMSECPAHAGLEACPVCGAVGHPDERYVCPDGTCSEYMTIRQSPRHLRLMEAK